MPHSICKASLYSSLYYHDVDATNRAIIIGAIAYGWAKVDNGKKATVVLN